MRPVAVNLGDEHEAARLLVGYTKFRSVSCLVRFLLREYLLDACLQYPIAPDQAPQIMQVYSERCAALVAGSGDKDEEKLNTK